jgi:hypothetical protein
LYTRLCNSVSPINEMTYSKIKQIRAIKLAAFLKSKSVNAVNKRIQIENNTVSALQKYHPLPLGLYVPSGVTYLAGNFRVELWVVIEMDEDNKDDEIIEEMGGLEVVELVIDAVVMVEEGKSRKSLQE